MSRVRVAPMNTPSSIQAAAPASGASTIQCSIPRASIRTRGAVVITSISAAPPSANPSARATQNPAPQTDAIRTPARSRGRDRAPTAWPTIASAAKAKPSSA